MNRQLAVKKVKAYIENPDLIKEPSMGEMADLVVLVLGAVEQIEAAIKAGRLDGKTPEPDKDYLSLEAAKRLLRVEVDKILSQTETALSTTSTELEKRVQQALQNIRNGKDGIVTDAEIQRAAEMAKALIELPDFDSLVAGNVQANGALIRDALESLPEGDEQLRIEAIQGLKKKLEDLDRRVGDSISGGLTRGGVLQLIAENGSGGSVSDEAYGGTWDGVTDEAPSKNAVYDKIQSLVLDAGTGDVVGPVSAVDDRIATFDGTTGKLIQDGGKTVANVLNTDNHTDGTTNKVFTATEKTKLAGIEAAADVTDTTNVTAAGALMDSEVTNLAQVKAFNSADYATAAQGTLAASASQPGHTHTAANITDFATAVAATAAVTANTAKVTNATHTGDVTGDTALTIAAGAVTLAKMANLAQDQFIGRTTASTGVPQTATITAAARTVLDDTTVAAMATTLGLGTASSPQFAGVNVGHATDTTIARVSAGVISVEGQTVATASNTLTFTNKTLTSPVINTPTGIVKGDVGLGNVDNTSDANKPVSTAQQTALDLKLNATVYDDADTSEVNTGTSTAKYVSPDSLAGSNLGIRYFPIALNGSTALTTSDKFYFRVPAALTGMNLVSVSATVGTGAAGSSSSGTPTFTVKNVTDAAQMLSTSLTVDANEYTSATAATAAVINAATDDVVTDDLIEVACTTAGTGVTYAVITLGFQLP